MVDVYCIYVEETLIQGDIRESKGGYFSLTGENKYSICENIEEECVIKAFSLAKINEWVMKCQEFVDYMNILNSIGALTIKHSITINIRRCKIPNKIIKKKLRKEGYI